MLLTIYLFYFYFPIYLKLVLHSNKYTKLHQHNNLHKKTAVLFQLTAPCAQMFNAVKKSKYSLVIRENYHSHQLRRKLVYIQNYL